MKVFQIFHQFIAQPGFPDILRDVVRGEKPLVGNQLLTVN